MQTKMSEKNECHSTWLLQRLKPPFANQSELTERWNSLSFGGGYKNGGLSDEALKLFSQFIQFDYMGAAEFEYGAVPKAFKAMTQPGSELTASRHAVSGPRYVGFFDLKGSPDERRQEKARREQEIRTAEIFILSPKRLLPHVEEIIDQLARLGNDRGELQETADFPRAAFGDPKSDRYLNTVGWLELDNGFMFFTDRTMFEACARIFGVEVSADLFQEKEKGAEVG